MPVKKIHSDKDYEEILEKSGQKLVVVDFTATWCGPCQRIAPIFEKLSDTYTGCVFLKVDVDENQEIAASNEVAAMPTFLFIKAKKEIGRLRGADPNGLEEMIKKHGGDEVAAPFQGEGKALGGTGGGQPVMVNVSAEALEKAQEILCVDDSQPLAKVNIRLADGSRLTVTLNLSQKVSLIRKFICNARPDQAAHCFSLMTAFPNQIIEDEEITIQDAKLAHAVVLQKIN